MESLKAQFNQLLSEHSSQYPEMIVQALQDHWLEFVSQNPAYDLQVQGDSFIRQLATC